MIFWTRAKLRSQLRAIAEAESDAKAWDLYTEPSTCTVTTYMLIGEHRLAGDTVQDAAKRALEAM